MLKTLSSNWSRCTMGPSRLAKDPWGTACWTASEQVHPDLWHVIGRIHLSGNISCIALGGMVNYLRFQQVAPVIPASTQAMCIQRIQWCKYWTCWICLAGHHRKGIFTVSLHLLMCIMLRSVDPLIRLGSNIFKATEVDAPSQLIRGFFSDCCQSWFSAY